MAFHARPDAHSGAGMLILPDVRGLHTFYEELALRFAEAGIEALAIDYFGRTAPQPPRGREFEYNPHVEQTRYATLLADMKAGRDALAERAGVRATFSVGFCYGGRLSFLAATRAELDLSGAVGFYGIPAGRARVDLPAPLDLAAETRCAVLGLFGGDDASIPTDSVAAYDRALSDAGVEHDLTTYPGAPHSFFDRKAADFAAESADAWRRVLEFVGRLTPEG